jgi:hypothetical protein
MQDIQSFISQLKRPKLLVRAARFGIDDYRRERDLRRLLKVDRVPRPGAALMALSEVEGEMNDLRIKKAATYSLAIHIDLLTAIMAECRAYEATRAAPAT